MAKTDAASVELMTEPNRKLSSTGILSICQQKRPTRPAVATVPTEDSTMAFAATGRAALHFVPKPP